MPKAVKNTEIDMQTRPKIQVKNRYIYIVSLFLVFSMVSIPDLTAQAPVPVFDKKHNKWSAILMKVQQASTLINTKVVLAVTTIRQAQDCFQGAFHC